MRRKRIDSIPEKGYDEYDRQTKAFVEASPREDDDFEFPPEEGC